MSPKLTIGQKLDFIMARRVHVTDIEEPLVRALWWKRWEWRNAEIIRDNAGPEFGDLIENAEAEVEYARKARAKIITHLWEQRKFDRLAAYYHHEAITARVAVGAVNLAEAVA